MRADIVCPLCVQLPVVGALVTVEVRIQLGASDQLAKLWFTLSTAAKNVGLWQVRRSTARCRARNKLNLK